MKAIKDERVYNLFDELKRHIEKVQGDSVDLGSIIRTTEELYDDMKQDIANKQYKTKFIKIKL